MNVLNTAKKILIDNVNRNYQEMRANHEEYGHAIFENGVKQCFDEEANEYYELKDVSTMIRDSHLGHANKLNAQKRDRPFLNEDPVINVEYKGKRVFLETGRQTWILLSGRFGHYLKLK